MDIKKLLISSFISLAISSMNSAHAQQKFTVEDITNLTGISDPKILPDAKSIPFVASKPDTMKHTMNAANTGDHPVPITQTYKLLHSLNGNGPETRFFAWPIPAHNASNPISQMDRDRLWIWWLNTYLK